MNTERFHAERLEGASLKSLAELARQARADILKMTTLAGSGHPGGSMSSIHFYLTLYSYANVRPDSSSDPNRDRIIIGHGHTSPGVYAALGRTGFYPIETAIVNFRKAGSAFEGRVEKGIPGVEWNTGNPYSLLRVIREIGIPSPQCGYVGDVVDDILAAQAVKKKFPMLAIGFLSVKKQRKTLKESLLKAGADLLIENSKDLLRFIDCPRIGTDKELYTLSLDGRGLPACR